MDIYLTCIYIISKKSLPKFVAFIIVDYCDFNEQFKYGKELAMRNNDIPFIFIKACEVDNLYLVKKYYPRLDIKKGFKSACKKNNLNIINFLKNFGIKKSFLKASVKAGYFETAWMLSKMKKTFRSFLLYYVLDDEFNLTKISKNKKIDMSLFIKKNVSFDFAIIEAIRSRQYSIIQKIVNLKIPCDVGLKTAVTCKDMKAMKMISNNIVNKISFLKKCIAKKLFEFFSIFDDEELAFYANYGMVLAAKYGNKDAYNTFIKLGGVSFNEAGSKACKYHNSGFNKNFTFCKYCDNKDNH